MPAKPFQPHRSLAAALVVALVGIVPSAFAAKPAADAPALLEEVTVTATRIPQPVSDVPVSVSVLPLNDLFAGRAVGLRDITRYEPGASIPGTFGVTGNALRNFPAARSVNIRGIDGNRILLQVDGLRQPEQFTFGGNQQIGRDYFEPALYRTAEILKGSASALYGSDAVGGVFSLLSPSVGDVLAANQTASAAVSSSFGSAAEEWVFSGAVAGRTGPVAAYVTGVYRTAQETDPEGNFEPDPAEIEAIAFLGRAEWQVAPGQQISVTAETLRRETEASFPSIRFLATQPGVTNLGQTGQQRIERDRVTLGHDWTREGGYFRNLQTRLSWQKATTEEDFVTVQRLQLGPPVTSASDRRRDRASDFANETLAASVQIESGADWLGARHRILWGLEGSDTRQERNEDFTQVALTGAPLSPTASKSLLGETFPLKRIPDADVWRYAFFVQDEVTLDRAQRWVVTPGVRIDRYDLDVDDSLAYRNVARGQAPVSFDAWSVSPKLGLIHRATDRVSYFFQYHRGFRNPTNEDLNGSIFNPNPPSTYRTVPNPDLESETSDSFEIGVRGRHPIARYQATAYYNFYSDFIDPFVLQPGGSFSNPANPVVFRSENISEARIYGFEMQLDLPLGEYTEALTGLTWTHAFSWNRGDNEERNVPLNSIDPWKWVSHLSYVASEGNWGARLTVTTAGRQDRIDTTELPRQNFAPIPGQPTPTQFVPGGFSVVDVSGFWEVTDRLRITATVYNLLDRKYWLWQDVRDQSASRPDLERFTQPGINFRLGATFRF